MSLIQLKKEGISCDNKVNALKRKPDMNDLETVQDLMKNFRINDYELQLKAVKIRRVSHLNSEGVVLEYDVKNNRKKHEKTSSLEMTVTMYDKNGKPYRLTVIAYTKIHEVSSAYDGLLQNILYRYARYCITKLDDSLPVKPTLLEKYRDVKLSLRKHINLPVRPVPKYTRVNREIPEVIVTEG